VYIENTMNAATETRSTFLATITRIADASTDSLLHMIIAHAEGSDTGDAAFTVLSGRLGVRGAHAAVEAEVQARSADVFCQQVAAMAREVLASL
jgi:hypothetical protein